MAEPKPLPDFQNEKQIREYFDRKREEIEILHHERLHRLTDKYYGNLKKAYEDEEKAIADLLETIG